MDPFHVKVAKELLEQLKKGAAPWQRPWTEQPLSLPFNPITGKRYKGINVLHLIMQDYADPRWMTYKQAQSQAWQVRKGEQSTAIQYWKHDERQPQLGPDGRPVLDAQGKVLQVMVPLERPKVFFAHVFNANQVDGIPELAPRQKPEWSPFERAETILQQSGATFRHGENTAFYRLTTDTIHLPSRYQFKTPEDYYGVALHELGHWTGHPSRLARDLQHPFGSQGYAKEELRAEIFSMMMEDELHIRHAPDRHIAYLQDWIKIITDDVFEVFRATADAERMQQYVLSMEQQQTHVQSQEQPTPTITEEQTMTAAALETPKDAQKRTYIKVSFEEKDQAKACGARWDRKLQCWYIPDGVSPEGFAAWSIVDQPSPPANKQTADRQYLAIPFKDRLIAKHAGALWDKARKSWYAGPKADMQILSKFLPANSQEQAPAMPPEAEFAEAMRAMGFIVTSPHPVMDGKKHRIAVTGDKKGEIAGFYVGHLDGHPAGYIKNNRTGQELKWKSKGYHVSHEQKKALEADLEQKRSARRAEQANIEAETANRCQTKIASLQPVIHPTPYLVNKRIPVSAGIYTTEKGLETYVPAHDVNGKIWSIQYIHEDGTKRFAKDGRKEGCFHVIGGMGGLANAKAIIIAEGYATAASIAEALKMPVVVAFDSGNLPHVAKALHEKFPQKPIIIAGDDDWHLEQTQGFNPGRLKAEEAAKAVGGQCVFPAFAPEDIKNNPKAFTDFNDLITKSSRPGKAIEQQIGQLLPQKKSLNNHKRANA